MPGLFGAFSLNPSRTLQTQLRRSVLEEMGARLAHTGRESVEHWNSPDERFAIARIGIPEFQTTHWPRPQTDEPLHCFFDGRLHPESAAAQANLARPAAEVAGQLRGLRGFFSAAVYDAKASRLVLAVDRHASRPICYAVVDQVLYFGPEVKAVLAAPGIRRDADPAACGLMLSGGYLLSHQTLCAAVRRLSGGQFLRAAENGISTPSYWKYRLSQSGDGCPSEELEAEMARLLRESVARNYTEPERTMILLSGGTDSRALLGGALAAVGGDGRRVCVASWNEEPARPRTDLAVVRELARRFQLRLQALPRPRAAYPRQFTRLNYIGDAFSDMASYHPYELDNHETLAAKGWTCALRGDECFGWASSVATVRDGLHELNLRRLSGVKRCVAALRPIAREHWVPAADAEIGSLERAFAGEPPDLAKDVLYFEQRLQGYLNATGYLKHVVCDHRNPLLDESLLDFNARVSAAQRLGKRMFRRAAARAFPEVWVVPFSRAANLVDWRRELTHDSAPRRYLECELNDARSALWDFVDPAAVQRTFESLPHGVHRPPLRARIYQHMRRFARAAVRLAPTVERRMRHAYHERAIRTEYFLMRVLVLKHWFDVFVAGDGSQGAYQRHQARVTHAARTA